MALSEAGATMASASGLRRIMEDIAITTSSSPGQRWLNLGIGNPASIPEVTAIWQRMTAEALRVNFASVSCRYGSSRGTPELIHAIVNYFNKRYDWNIGPQNVVVGPGSQMLCFIAAALYTGPSSGRSTNLVIPLLPDYTGYQGLCMTPGGILGVEPDVQRATGRRFRYQFDFLALERQKDIGMILLSSPSNPSGRCVTSDELERLIYSAETADVPLLIDNAYGEPFPSIGDALLAPIWHRNVINCFTMSKVGLPGERIGFAIGDERYLHSMVSFIANSALHAPQLVQMAVARALDSGDLDAVVSSAIRPFYAERRKLGERLLHSALPASVAWRLHASDGGMFSWIWVEDDWFDDGAFYQIMRDKGVFIVPGRYFFVEPENGSRLGAHARQCFRISLSTDEATLREGICLIAEALAEMQSRKS